MYDWLLHLIQTYPELIAIATGLIAPMALTQMLYLWWYPATWTTRECFQVTSVVDLLFCGLFTSNLWHYLDQKDQHGLIVVSSIAVAFCAPLAHTVVLRFVMHRWPWLEKAP